MRTLSIELGFALAAAVASILTTIAWGSDSALLAKADSLYAAERGARPCEHQTEYRQFDFWLGDWNVYNPTGQLAATSRIENLVASCVIFENYQQTDGYLGKSMSFYDAGLSKWRQIWVDRQGKVLDFTGRFEDGAMRFEGENRDAPSGAPRFRRMTLSAKGPDEVLQQGESSLDAVSWSLDYELTYKRQSP